jgi:aminoglycoside phosphotransferase
MRYEMENQYSDLHKDAYGFRPRDINISEWSYEELVEETDRMFRHMESQAEADAQWEIQEAAYRAEQEAEHAAWLAEQPLPIDYVAANYQEGWL